MSNFAQRREFTPRSDRGDGSQREYGNRIVFDGKRMRKSIQRRTVDYNHSITRWRQMSPFIKNKRDLPFLRPDSNFIFDLLPPSAYTNNPMNAVTTKFVHTSTNKNRCPVNVIRWTPEGRRLVTGSSSGEFTLWNGLTFNFETILQAHDTAVRAMKWSHNGDWMVTADHHGFIKYWQINMNPLKIFQGHKEAIRDLSFSPSDARFATCSDDGTIKIWNFHEGIEERTLTGHGWDVKCVDWHPQKSLLASGSKDNLVKLWDPKSGRALTTLHGHKNTILGLQWNRNGNWLATAARDQLVKIYDIRMMKDLQTFRGHKKEVCSVAWHPQHESLLATGGSEGSIMFWIMGQSEPSGIMENAHDSNVWSLDWHPVGHILVSGSNDHTTRFWTRNRPGESMQDKFNVGIAKAEELGLNDLGADQDDDEFVPGLGNFNPMLGGGFGITPMSGIPGLGSGPAGPTVSGPAVGTIPGLSSNPGPLPGLGGNTGALPGLGGNPGALPGLGMGGPTPHPPSFGGQGPPNFGMGGLGIQRQGGPPSHFGNGPPGQWQGGMDRPQRGNWGDRDGNNGHGSHFDGGRGRGRGGYNHDRRGRGGFRGGGGGGQQ